MNAKPKFTKRWSEEPIWRCGLLEIRDVKTKAGAFRRNGYDDTARYNLWVGWDMTVREISPSLASLKAFALDRFDPETGEELDRGQ